MSTEALLADAVLQKIRRLVFDDNAFCEEMKWAELINSDELKAADPDLVAINADWLGELESFTEQYKRKHGI